MVSRKLHAENCQHTPCISCIPLRKDWIVVFGVRECRFLYSSRARMDTAYLGEKGAQGTMPWRTSAAATVLSIASSVYVTSVVPVRGLNE